MPRVAPGQQGDFSKAHHHGPNKQHFGDVANSNQEKDMLLNFEQYTNKGSDEAMPSMKTGAGGEEGPRKHHHKHHDHKPHHHKHHHHGGDRQGSREGRRRSKEERRRSREERRRSREAGDRGDSAPPQMQPYGPNSRPVSAGYPPPSPGMGMRTTEMVKTTQMSEDTSGFIRCDILAAVIAFAYAFAIAIFILAIWCYRQDSKWNSIVHNERPFPVIANEDFFGGKYLFIYTNNDDEGLPRAKVHMLRENRWLELMHLMFICAFLILTVFQFTAYVTRGPEDHSKLIICYYTVFGGLGLIVALFPLLSWHNQEYGYKASRHYLADFARRVWNASPDNWRPGLSNATAQDAYTLSRVMKFCYDASQDGITIDRDIRFLPLFKRRYRLSQLQTLGFCTHHKFKIINTILSTIFAIICCIIPCVYCFKEGEALEDDTEWQRRKMRRGERGPPGPMMMMGPPPPRMEDRDVERGRRSADHPPREKVHSHYTGPDGRALSHKENKEIQKWIRYVEGDDL